MFAWTYSDGTIASTVASIDGLRKRTRALEDIVTQLIVWLDREADDGLVQLLTKGDGEIHNNEQRKYLLGMVFAFRAAASQGRKLLAESAVADQVVAL